MNDLLTVSNGQPTASSRDIAEHFGKGHNHVLRDIDTLKEDVSNFGQMFFDTEIPDSYGRPQRAYLEMMAYGDFLIDSCHVWEGGVELVLMQQFCKKS